MLTQIISNKDEIIVDGFIIPAKRHINADGTFVLVPENTQIANDVYINPSCQITGTGVVIEYGVCISGDNIKIPGWWVLLGSTTEVSGNDVTIRNWVKMPYGTKVVGDNVVLGDNISHVIIANAQINSHVEVHGGSVICEKAEIGEYSVIKPNCIIPPNTIIPSHSIVERSEVNLHYEK